MSFDYQAIFTACKFGIFGAIVAGIFGYLIGKTLERSDTKSDTK